MIKNLRAWAKTLKVKIVALYLAARDERVPWFARMTAGLVVAYALSPVDLIPDFLPVIGYIDDLVLIPLGIWLTIRMIPGTAWQEIEAIAEGTESRLPLNWKAGAIVIAVWVLTLVTVTIWALQYY